MDSYAFGDRLFFYLSPLVEDSINIPNNYVLKVYFQSLAHNRDIPNFTIAKKPKLSQMVRASTDRNLVALALSLPNTLSQSNTERLDLGSNNTKAGISRARRNANSLPQGAVKPHCRLLGVLGLKLNI